MMMFMRVVILNGVYLSKHPQVTLARNVEHGLGNIL